MPLRRFKFFDREVVLYARPGLVMEGDSGDWVTADGLTFNRPGGGARRSSEDRAPGADQLRVLETDPWCSRPGFVSGRHDPDNSRDDDGLGVGLLHQLDASATRGESAAPRAIRVTFDDYFVSKEIGLNEDTRKLVIWTSRSVTLHHRQEEGVCELSSP